MHKTQTTLVCTYRAIKSIKFMCFIHTCVLEFFTVIPLKVGCNLADVEQIVAWDEVSRADVQIAQQELIA